MPQFRRKTVGLIGSRGFVSLDGFRSRLGYLSTATRRTTDRKNIASSYRTHFHSVLSRCWLGDRKGIRPVKRWV